MDTTASPKQKINIGIDLRIVIAVLLIVIAGMLFIWKPWAGAAGERTVRVTGEATLKSAPDEFIFSPSYQFKNENKDAALAELSKKSDELTAKLKGLGVPANAIKTDSGGSYFPSYDDRDSKELTYTLQLTVTVDNLALAQKVQDYLVTTTPVGSVSPQAAFSDQKRKELESKARDLATKDARSKADQSAKNLGFSVSKVKSVTDGTGFDVLPVEGALVRDNAAGKSSLQVQPGENELNYSVTVVYFIR